MAEEDGDLLTGAGSDRAALGMAMNASTAAEAGAYLREQTELARLQKANLVEQNAFEVSHLRWRRFNDQMKGALQIMLVAVGLLLVAGIAAAVWRASQAEGLVVDAFSVPPSFAARGIGGDVLAEDFTNKLVAIRKAATGYTSASEVSRDHANDLSVEIPDTGMSIATAWRLLRSWLGHERHLSGSLRETGDGKLNLTTELDGASAIAVSGADLDTLEHDNAEKMFCSADSIGCFNYLIGQRRWTDIYARAQAALAAAQEPADLASAYSIAGMARTILRGDEAGGLAMLKAAVGYAPQLAGTHLQVMKLDAYLGHAADEVTAARRLITLSESDQPKRLRGSGFARIQYEASQAIDYWTGDFTAQRQLGCFESCVVADDFMALADTESLLHEETQARRLIARGRLAGDAATLRAQSEAVSYADRGDWMHAAAAARNGINANRTDPDPWNRFSYAEAEHILTRDLAVAQAHLGDFAGARATLAATHADCYICLVGRGDVETIARNWSAAEGWFKHAAAAAPSIPFADADWGEMLLIKGDLDGAIAKFTAADKKGPHFADPLEMWGEALIAKNRSDLALAKFEEAAKYAPNWGRLHVKWGEALLWSGDKPDAQKQFATAAKLDLTSAEKAQLARMEAGHG